VITTTATALKALPIAAAPVLMGYALWRSRSVSRWLAALFVIGLGVAEFQSSGGPIVVLYMLPFAAAMVLLAARLWQAAALPASQPQPRPTAVPV
jgi:fucose permease